MWQEKCISATHRGRRQQLWVDVIGRSVLSAVTYPADEPNNKDSWNCFREVFIAANFNKGLCNCANAYSSYKCWVLGGSELVYEDTCSEVLSPPIHHPSNLPSISFHRWRFADSAYSIRVCGVARDTRVVINYSVCMSGIWISLRWEYNWRSLNVKYQWYFVINEVIRHPCRPSTEDKPKAAVTVLTFEGNFSLDFMIFCP